MARPLHKLSAKTVERASTPGLYADGGGLYLQVSQWETKSWLFRFTLDGRPRKMGLGPLHTVSLARARDEALACRLLLRDGIDPIELKNEKIAERKAAAKRAMTFRECAEAYIKAHSPTWKNDKHRAQWPATLSTYVYPVVGDLPVDKVDLPLVLKVLEPIWREKPETASRLRGRIEKVLDWAASRKLRSGENPARWKGHLEHQLAAPSKIKKVEHHAALPYADMPAFMAGLRGMDGISPRALEFAILTAARTGEVVGARWDEIDLPSRMWIVPAERMKGGREHRVPLSDRALEILGALPREGEFVFLGSRKGKPLSNMALLMTLRRMERGDLTAHGFRSTFRDWAAEQTAYPSEMCEMALAHAVSDKVEAAYRRGDMIEKRRRLMAEWSAYCAATPVAERINVVAMRAGA
jgi:integrase